MNHPALPALLVDGPAQAPLTVILAHGAGAGMDSPFMEFFAQGLAEGGYRVVRFEFPYMAQRRHGGKRRPPDAQAVLRETWLQAIQEAAADRFVIGGKSMGGRIASLIADQVHAAGLVCLGYPFHPASRPRETRIEHLETLRTPTLILQGTRDPLGKLDEVLDYPLSPAIGFHWIEDGDHSFKPRRSSGKNETENWEQTLRELKDFLQECREETA